MLKPRLRLRTKIVLWFILLVGLQGVLLTISVDQLVLSELKEMAKSKGAHLSESLLTRSKDLLLTGDVVKLYTLLQEEQRTTPEVRYAFVLDHEGNLVAHTFREGLPAVLLSVHPAGSGSRSRLVQVSNELLYDLQAVEEWGTLRLGLSLSEIEGTVLRIRSYVMLATFASILAVFALALTVSRPVERLTSFVAKAAAAGTHGADPEVLSTLETSKLCEAFGSVMHQLRLKVEELTDSEKTVRRQKEYIENLHDSLGMGIVVLSAEKGIEFANKLACDQLGIVSGGDAKGLLDLDPVNGTDRSLLELVGSRQPFQELWRGRSGNVYEIEGMPIRNLDGSESVLLRLQDVSEEIALREKLQRSQKMAYLGGLAASVAHGINTPLGVVLMKSEMLLADAKGEGLPEKYIHELSKIRGHTARAGQIIGGLLLFSRYASEKIRRQRVVFNLNDLVPETLGLLEERLLAQDVKVNLALAEKLPEVYGDREAVQQVLINLADNAIDAMEDGGEISISTEVEEGPGGTFICLKVSDTGCGMTEEVKTKALEPFFTTKDAARGTGLGLSISSGIISEHGGDIAIESRPGQGTSVVVRLPSGGM
ncbi:MAG: ATP-binding protein [Candidatus Methylomirabilales bacterium]